MYYVALDGCVATRAYCIMHWVQIKETREATGIIPCRYPNCKMTCLKFDNELPIRATKNSSIISLYFAFNFAALRVISAYSQVCCVLSDKTQNAGMAKFCVPLQLADFCDMQDPLARPLWYFRVPTVEGCLCTHVSAVKRDALKRPFPVGACICLPRADAICHTARALRCQVPQKHFFFSSLECPGFAPGLYGHFTRTGVEHIVKKARRSV